MSHKFCSTKNTPEDWEKDWFLNLRLISADNPLRTSYFRSDVSVKEEKLRHLRTNRKTIHPFSKFRAWYEMYLIFLYASVLLTKPMDAGFVRIRSEHLMIEYIYYTIFTDILCWIDIVMNFFVGYNIEKYRLIELRRWYIFKNYVFSPYFIFDVLSSIPISSLFEVDDVPTRRYLFGVVGIFSLLKVFKVVTFIGCIGRTAEYFRIMTKGGMFLVCTIIGALVTFHWLACLQFAVPKLVRRYFSEDDRRLGWIYMDRLFTKPIPVQYIHCFFKSSAYILGARLMIYPMQLYEEYTLAIFTYVVGKIVIAFIWIIFAVTILNARFMNIKFAEVLNQLEEYMRYKRLPLNLRNRIYQYFMFKYRNRYFKEQLITSLLSERLKRESNLHVCKSLINNVTLFAGLSYKELSKVVDYLIPEIFLPNDTIIQSGTYGDAMYFLSSGTVAVYTRSGREIGHLQDGAYFGEMSLILKNQMRIVTVVAIETSHVYRLNRKDMEKHLLANAKIRANLLKEAEQRLIEANKMEEEYKQMLFEQSIRS